EPTVASTQIREVPSERRWAAVTGLVQGWTERDPDAAGAWIETLTDLPLRREAKKDYIQKWSERDPKGAADYMLQNWLSNNTNNELIDYIISNWTRIDEGAAFSWVAALPTGEMREDVLYDFLTSVPDSHRAAELWVSQFGDGRGLSGWSSARYIARDLAAEAGFDAGADFLAKVPKKVRELASREFLNAEIERTGAGETTAPILRRPPGPERVDLLRAMFQRLADNGQATEARPLLNSVPSG